jgi:hypothetical protein
LRCALITRSSGHGRSGAAFLKSKRSSSSSATASPPAVRSGTRTALDLIARRTETAKRLSSTAKRYAPAEDRKQKAVLWTADRLKGHCDKTFAQASGRGFAPRLSKGTLQLSTRCSSIHFPPRRSFAVSILGESEEEGVGELRWTTASLRPARDRSCAETGDAAQVVNDSSKTSVCLDLGRCMAGLDDVQLGCPICITRGRRSLRSLLSYSLTNITYAGATRASTQRWQFLGERKSQVSPGQSLQLKIVDPDVGSIGWRRSARQIP